VDLQFNNRLGCEAHHDSTITVLFVWVVRLVPRREVCAKGVGAARLSEARTFARRAFRHPACILCRVITSFGSRVVLHEEMGLDYIVCSVPVPFPIHASFVWIYSLLEPPVPCAGLLPDAHLCRHDFGVLTFDLFSVDSPQPRKKPEVQVQVGETGWQPKAAVSLGLESIAAWRHWQAAGLFLRHRHGVAQLLGHLLTFNHVLLYGH